MKTSIEIDDAPIANALKILIVSNVWIDYFNGQSTPQVDAFDNLLGVQPFTPPYPAP